MTNIEAGEVKECSTCWTESHQTDFIGFSCNHTICHGCMTKQFNAYKNDRGRGLQCPYIECKRDISDENEFVNRERWNTLLGKNKVDEIIRILKEQAEEKLQQASSKGLDRKARRWLRKNTKPCPKCHQGIQKNGGCNHMTCTKCSHQFCWKCKSNWPSGCRPYACSKVITGVSDEVALVLEDALDIGSVCLALGATGGVISYANQSYKNKKRSIEEVTQSQVKQPTSWLGKKIDALKQKTKFTASFSKEHLASKVITMPGTLLQTTIGALTYYGLQECDEMIEDHGIASISPLERRIMYVGVAGVIAFLTKPITKLFASNVAFEKLAKDQFFIKLLQATNFDEILVNKEQLIAYNALIASINQHNVTRLQLRRAFGTHVTSVSDIDDRMRTWLMVIVAREIGKVDDVQDAVLEQNLRYLEHLHKMLAEQKQSELTKQAQEIIEQIINHMQDIKK